MGRGRQGHAPGLCWLLAHGGFVLSSELEDLQGPSYSVDDVIVLEVEVKGSAEPFRVLLEPYALIIPGESYVGINVKKDFKVGPCLSRPRPAARVLSLDLGVRMGLESRLSGPLTNGFAQLPGRALYLLPAPSGQWGGGTRSTVHGSVVGYGTPNRAASCGCCWTVRNQL